LKEITMAWRLFFTIIAQVGLAALVLSVSIVLIGGAVRTTLTEMRGSKNKNQDA
jgi:hypothetical protein